MAHITLVSATKLRVVEALEQITLPPAETITLGEVCRLDTATGKATGANGSAAGECRPIGIAVEVGPASVTLLRRGVIDGFDLSGQAYDADVYLDDTDGVIADATGTVTLIVGKVIPGFNTTLGTAADKLLRVDF